MSKIVEILILRITTEGNSYFRDIQKLERRLKAVTQKVL